MLVISLQSDVVKVLRISNNLSACLPIVMENVKHLLWPQNCCVQTDNGISDPCHNERSYPFVINKPMYI